MEETFLCLEHISISLETSLRNCKLNLKPAFPAALMKNMKVFIILKIKIIIRSDVFLRSNPMSRACSGNGQFLLFIHNNDSLRTLRKIKLYLEYGFEMNWLRFSFMANASQNDSNSLNVSLHCIRFVRSPIES